MFVQNLNYYMRIGYEIKTKTALNSETQFLRNECYLYVYKILEYKVDN